MNKMCIYGIKVFTRLYLSYFIKYTRQKYLATRPWYIGSSTITVYFTERKHGVILTYKVESLEELKFNPGFRVIGEYLSQIDSILGVNFLIDS